MPLPISTVRPATASPSGRWDHAGGAHSAIDIPSHGPSAYQREESQGCLSGLPPLGRPGTGAVITACGMAAFGGSVYLFVDAVKKQVPLDPDATVGDQSAQLVGASVLGVTAIAFGVCYCTRLTWARAG